MIKLFKKLCKFETLRSILFLLSESSSLVLHTYYIKEKCTGKWASCKAQTESSGSA